MSPPNILQQIVETKKQEVAEAKKRVPLDDLKRQCASAEATRNFFAALTKTPNGLANVIAEVKKASPSAGVMKSDFDPVAQARVYHEAGADALSVLTDEHYFKGHLSYLKMIRDAVPLPILRKDFMIDPYQIYEARAAGADAILLIAEILTDSQISDFQILATELNLTTLIEVHEMDSLLRVRNAVGFPMRSYSLLGINNRDLRTFTVDINNTIRLADIVPDRSVLVAESGIKTQNDVRRLNAAGVKILLVGETLMRSGNVKDAMKELKGT